MKSTLQRITEEIIQPLTREHCINGISNKLSDIWLPAITSKKDQKTEEEHYRQNSPLEIHKSPPNQHIP